MEKAIFVFCAFLFTFDYRVMCQKNQEITEPDMIRNVYLKIEKRLWETVINTQFKSQSEKLKNIYVEHSNFASTYLHDSIDIDDLKALIETNGWHHLQSDIVSVHRLFISFRQHVTRESKNADKDAFNEETSLDLTEHILNDPTWPLKTALENLYKVTLKDELYYQDISMKFTCNLQRSVQQILYQLYNAVAIVEVQAYMMTQWAHMVRTIYQKGEHGN